MIRWPGINEWLFSVKTFAAAMLALVTGMGHADDTLDTIDRYVTFSGFGTLGVVHSDYSQADFIANVTQPRGAGFSSWSPTLDSDLGGQAKFTLTDSLSGVLQVLSRDDAPAGASAAALVKGQPR